MLFRSGNKRVLNVFNKFTQLDENACIGKCILRLRTLGLRAVMRPEIQPILFSVLNEGEVAIFSSLSVS